MKTSLANKRVSDLTVGQLFKIFDAEMDKKLDIREGILIEIMPQVVWNAENNIKPRPEVVRALVADFLEPLINEERAKIKT